MPRKPISFELDFMIKDIFPRFTVKQFDDVSFNIKPLNQGLEYDTSNMIGKIFVGVNNDMFMQTTDITVSSDNINVLLDKNMLQKNGRAYAEIELTDEAGTITSSSFIFDIDPKIGEGGMIPGEYEGFVEKYERLISEFKAQINSSIDNSNNLIDKTIKNCNTSVDTKLSTVDSRLNSKVAEVDSKLDTVDRLITAKVSDFERRFSALTSSQQQNSEVIDAREGEVSLKARLDKDIENPKKLYTSIEGTEISVDSLEGCLKDIEILGNTVQDQDNLADIRSVGDKLENQELYEIPVLSTNGLDSSDSNYQEHKLTILSPTPLEKVRDVADRIICKDGVWGVEKNIEKQILNGSENWRKDGLYYDYRVQTNITPGYSYLSSLICNRFPEVKYTEWDKGNKITGIDIIYGIRIRTENFDNETLEDFKNSLQENNVIVYYNTQETPTFIPLPHDQQIKLRTFANKTNIHFLTEIEPTLKAQVPKSLGASVSSHSEQIDNLSKELEKINNLEESVTSEVISESDFITVENTSNGYFENVKLEGKTLVNLNDIPYGFIVNDNGSICHIPNGGKYLHNIKPNTIYTFIVHGMNSKFNNKYIITHVMEGTSTMINGVGMFRSNSVIDYSKNRNPHLYGTGLTNEDVSNLKLVILEGDHTQNPPSFFEGLKSVGDGVEEISVLSANKEETKQDKKRILYYNDETDTWEKPILRQWDSIEKHSDGKYYYHKRSGEVVLNGSESWKDRSSVYASDTQTRFSLIFNIKPCDWGEKSIICDKYEVLGALGEASSVTDNGIWQHTSGSQLYITVPKTTLSEFKAWLQANPVTVVYQLAEEKVYECTNIDLITYENETNLVVKSGVLNPKVTLKVKKGIGNVVTMLQNKVAMLEDLVNKLIQK